MIAKLRHPLTIGLIATVVSAALGAGLCWRIAIPLIERAAANRAKSPASPKERGWDFWTIEIENLANELRGERERLRQLAESLDQRALRIATEEKDLKKVRVEVEALRQEIGTKVTEITADEAKNIRTLAQTYATLTPRGAVAIFRELDETTSVKILALMKPDVVGPIFEEMSRSAGTEGPLARRAAVLSEKLRLMKAKATGQN